jgi:hypothetical protein
MVGQPAGGPKQCQIGGKLHIEVQFAAHMQKTF